MAKYWFRFFDRNEQLVKAERLIALDDEKAIANARGAAPIGTSDFRCGEMSTSSMKRMSHCAVRWNASYAPPPTEWMIA